MIRLKNIILNLAVYLTFVIFILFIAKALIPRLLENPNQRIHPPTDLLDDLQINCTNILQGFKNENTLELINTKMIENKMWNSTDRCQTLTSMFRFNKVPLSEEEARFPLSFGLLVYKELSQVLFLLSSIYQPQNEYCIAVGENSAPAFLILLKELANCFPNVYFMKRPPIKWGSFEIINSVYGCLEFLSHLKSDWKYFQYLSGVDIPLKTNLEMVRILKRLNGTVNIGISTYEDRLLNGKNKTESPLPLFKSSLSSLIPRKAANYLSSSSVPQQLLEFLRTTWVADEGFWGTLFGNKDLFNVPGSFNFNDPLTNGWGNYVSRHQLWVESECHNYMKDRSCVFGIGDVPNLMKSRALVAHKLYIESEPEAFFCLLKRHRHRTINPDLTSDSL
ncbi:GLYcosylation related [Caenorhabditis elegans]|uniref:GLYcosylation related n=1 Tax=Caenorhabditis elegans TaxID=6239 RepID=O02315_CAEEL|nr:GLYcosylation related [Caenorhabditis elegans]CAB05621.2 GLYcosylation related [Caenorhabditis elegans]|eukprot:NP_493134.2 GLYcosylation related [Caenorhabditis elegans]